MVSGEIQLTATVRNIKNIRKLDESVMKEVAKDKDMIAAITDLVNI